MSNLTFAGNANEVQVYNAVLNHDVAKFREALSEGFDPEHIFNFGAHAVDEFNLLTHALKSDFREGVEILLRETDIDTWTGFSEACVNKDDEMIRVFLQISCERRRWSSDYLFILLNHDIVDMALEFIQRDGFNVDDQSLNNQMEGQSPLHVSALCQEPQILECLIKRGGKLDIKDAADCTPLFVACMQGSYESYECCQCLLRHGANPNYFARQATVRSLRSPLFALCFVSESPYKEEILELLISAGLDVNMERWILNRNLTLHVADGTLRLLTSLCRVPSTLEIICVRAIRHHLSKLTTGRSILTMVQKLPVPLLLKARLIVSDFDRGLRDNSITS